MTSEIDILIRSLKVLITAQGEDATITLGGLLHILESVKFRKTM